MSNSSLPKLPEEISAVFSELHNGSDRASAIVGGAYVESELENALIRSMHKDETITKELFKFTGALGSFGAKIQVGKLTGLYGYEFYRDLETIKKIRNQFAHSVSIRSFDVQPMTDWTGNLKTYQDWFDVARQFGTAPETPRRRFELAVVGCMMGLSARTAMLMPNPVI